MDKLLEVREFDVITCNADFKNDASLRYLNKDTFDELENFILSLADTNEAKEFDAMDFLKISSRRNVGKVIQAKNYVGLIQMKNGFQVQILPKIDNSDMEDIKKTFLRMLRSMKDFPSKVFNDANLKMDRMNLYEIFINMYLQEVRAIVKKGIRSAYLGQEDNQRFYRGKLKVSEHIKQNVVHKERFYVAYDEFDVNRPENRLIKSTLLKLQKLTSSDENNKEIRQMLISFEMITPSDNYERDFSKIRIDRNTKDYKLLMQWSKVFLMNQSFTTFSGNTSARALLFPMEKVFEAYVARNIKKVFADENWEISTQDKGFYLFETPQQFALRPDIVITRDDGTQIILDTKWKSLYKNPRQNYGISQGDMYQMFAYAKKYQTSEIWLLYPINNEMRYEEDIRFVSNDKDTNEKDVIVRVFFVDVTDIEDSLMELKKKIICEGTVDHTIQKLKWLLVPENWMASRNREEMFSRLTNNLAVELCHWEDLGHYTDYIEMSGEVIDRNLADPVGLDIDTCVATLICVHREQYWNGGYSDVITPRVENGGLLNMVNKLQVLIEEK